MFNKKIKNDIAEIKTLLSNFVQSQNTNHQNTNKILTGIENAIGDIDCGAGNVSLDSETLGCLSEISKQIKCNGICVSDWFRKFSDSFEKISESLSVRPQRYKETDKRIGGKSK